MAEFCGHSAGTASYIDRGFWRKFTPNLPEAWQSQQPSSRKALVLRYPGEYPCLERRAAPWRRRILRGARRLERAPQTRYSNGRCITMRSSKSPLAPKKKTVSPDGNLLATSDARRAVKIHTTSSPTLTYQVTAQDFVLDLAFSPDLRRIYDLRGDYGNFWGPNTLLR